MMRKTGKKENLERWLNQTVVVSSLRGNSKPMLKVGVLKFLPRPDFPGYYVEENSGAIMQIARKYISKIRKIGDARVINLDYLEAYANKINKPK